MNLLGYRLVYTISLTYGFEMSSGNRNKGDLMAKTPKKKRPPIESIDQIDYEALKKTMRTSAIGGMRRCYSYCDLTKLKRFECVSETTGPRGGKMYDCEECGDAFGTADTRVDHVVPVVPTDTYQQDMSLDLFLDRLVCDYDNLQLLCKTCHQMKTNIEKSERKRNGDMRKMEKALEG